MGVDLGVFVVVCLFLLIAGLCFSIALSLARYFMQKRISVETLFIGLKPKLWMTAGLGVFFISLYTGIVWGISYWFDAEMRHIVFQMAYSYPLYFVYGGLATFILISLIILVVRSLIKRLYNCS